MCMAIPMQIVRLEGLRAFCRGADREGVVDLSLVGPQPVGGWVLTHMGVAREAIDAEQAGQIERALAGLRAVLAGGDLGDAFADLEGREPQLPPDFAEAVRDDRDTA